MGGSNSIVRNQSKKGFELVFISKMLSSGCLQLKTDFNLRNLFVDFIKDGEWLVDLIDDFQYNKDEEDPLLYKYQCIKRCDVSNIIPFTREKSNSGTISSTRSEFDDGDDMQMFKLSSLFSNENEIKAFIICSLFPLFTQNDLLNTHKLNQDALEILLQGASMFDSEELVSYLSNPDSSIIDDLYDAIENLPILLRIYDNNNIDGDSSSMLAYSNCHEDYTTFGSGISSSRSSGGSTFSIDDDMQPQQKYANCKSTSSISSNGDSSTSASVRAIITSADTCAISDYTTILTHLPVISTNKTHSYTVVAQYTCPILSIKHKEQQVAHTYSDAELLKGINLVENFLALLPGILY